jgi:hypothetical protein
MPRILLSMDTTTLDFTLNKFSLSKDVMLSVELLFLVQMLMLKKFLVKAGLKWSTPQ